MTAVLEIEPALKPFLMVVNQSDDPDHKRFIDRFAQKTLEDRGRFSCLYLHHEGWEPYMPGTTLTAPWFSGMTSPLTAPSLETGEENPMAAEAPTCAATLAKAATLGLVMMSMAFVAMGFLGQVWFP